MTDHAPVDKLVADYVALRDQKERIARERKDIDARIHRAMKTIESRLLAQLDQLGAESLRTAAGTCFRSMKTSAIVEDRDAFISFAVAHPEFLESRANKTAVEEYLDTKGELPPGVRVTRTHAVNIRRS